MDKFVKKLDADTLKAGDRFIERIKSGIHSKRTLPNTSPDYPLDKASDSFDHFLKTEEFKNSVKE